MQVSRLRQTLSIHLPIVIMAVAVWMFVIPAMMLNPGCAGNTARKTVGISSLLIAVGGVDQDARAGIATLPENEQPAAIQTLNAFTTGLASKDLATVNEQAGPLWPAVKGYAERGIDAQVAAGKITPALAESKRERVVQFGLTLNKLGP
jgi:hypothetical protein